MPRLFYRSFQNINSDNVANRLTERERQVLRCLKHCRISRDIADILGISERTVKFHVCNIITKLRVKNRTQAVAAAMEKGLL